MHIGVEMCEPDCIKYTSGDKFTCSNLAKAKEMVKRTYDAAVELFAMLCKEYELDPLADGVVISHNEGRLRGIASGHTDPEHLWKQLGMSYTMDSFRKAVKAAIGGDSVKDETAQDNSNSVLYRVQVGAYKDKKNADAMLAKVKAAGFDAFITTNGGTVASSTPEKKTVEQIAREVIAGKWGNGTDRKNRLTAAGYDYDAVQKAVNNLLR